MQVFFDEITKNLVDEHGIIHLVYELESGTEVYYKDVLVKVAGKVGRPTLLMNNLYREMIDRIVTPDTNNISSHINKKMGRDSNLIKNKYATVECVNGIYGFKLNDSIREKYVEVYNNWINLNKSRIVASRTGRITNFPEEISEGLCCLELNKYLYYKKSPLVSKNKITFDCFDYNNTFQVKGSCSTGPTSFSPKDFYDSILFFKFDISTTEYKIYQIDKCDIDNIKVNEKETIADQRKKGIRPRTNLDNYIFNKQIKPITIGKLIKEKICNN